ncbi:ABC transporter substrate-binding protein [Lederbergia sp. NSJ-179]|uniref:ABC transporter substrate-binding protein n=1 Tax=Lederbergia sp. NSJ-179 TaxID=2931402 RepID=UPI001FD3F675|nr:ABC transporter substrate-binding protein [Lederbergia sp. NSJ-179]MCJ7842339.1 ABC transporter substrate-binding protein [Lederbergia sp. NSJ-179]
MKSRLWIISLFILFLLTGCATKEGVGEQSKVAKGEHQGVGNKIEKDAAGKLTVVDDLGNEVTLEKKPERIVVLSPSHLKLLYDLGGEAVGRTTLSPDRIPEGAEDIADVGHHTNVNIEEILALEPDLVIGNSILHKKLIPILADSHIPFINLDMILLEDVKRNAKLVGKILDNSELAAKKIGQLEQEIKEIQEKINHYRGKEEMKKIVIFNITPNNVTVNRENTIPGEISKLLGLTNIAEDAAPLEDNPTQTAFSLEKVVEVDPDMIFVVHHGDKSKAEERMDIDMKNSPAWSTLTAVQNDQVHFLPGNLFLSNSGLDYSESIQYLAKLVYPEVFNDVE